jgi:beta-N-acetylhexosaminidase
VAAEDPARQADFEGIVFSDDLGMEGASTAGGMSARANAALKRGCDMILICNDPRAQDTLLEGLERRAVAPTLARRLEKLRGRRDLDRPHSRRARTTWPPRRNLARIRSS